MRNLLRSADLSLADIKEIFSRADYFRTHKQTDALKDKVIGLLFTENSTRTRVSFEMAGKRMGGQTVTISAGGSSMAKGETEMDTARVFSCNGADIMVVRSATEGLHHEIAQTLGLPVINAGEGKIDHPSQGLLDAYTLLQHFGDLKGKTIALIGDVRHSRVASSNRILLPLFGAKVNLIGPSYFMPDKCQEDCFSNLRDGLKNVDAVITLRIQKERLESDIVDLSWSDYARDFCLTKEALGYANDGAVVLDPMPMNRGVQISDDVADGAQSLIYKQMENGLFIRMAIYEWVLS